MLKWDFYAGLRSCVNGWNGGPLVGILVEVIVNLALFSKSDFDWYTKNARPSLPDLGAPVAPRFDGTLAVGVYGCPVVESPGFERGLEGDFAPLLGSKEFVPCL